MRKQYEELRSALYICLLKHPIHLPELCDNISPPNHNNDSIRIVLKSGISWEFLGKPPKIPLFFFLKRNKCKVEDGIKYAKFKGKWESDNRIPYELIDKFDFYSFMLNKEGIRCLQLKYEIKPDSIGNLTVINDEIKQFNILPR